MNVGQIKELGERIRNNISKVIVGKEDVIDKVLTALFVRDMFYWKMCLVQVKHHWPSRFPDL